MRFLLLTFFILVLGTGAVLSCVSFAQGFSKTSAWDGTCIDRNMSVSQYAQSVDVIFKGNFIESGKDDIGHYKEFLVLKPLKGFDQGQAKIKIYNASRQNYPHGSLVVAVKAQQGHLNEECFFSSYNFNNTLDALRLELLFDPSLYNYFSVGSSLIASISSTFIQGFIFLIIFYFGYIFIGLLVLGFWLAMNIFHRKT